MITGRFSELFKRAIGEYISYVQLILECTDWRIVLMSDYPDGDDAIASIECIYGRRLANLRLAKDFFDTTDDAQRHTLVHEVLHILTDGCANVIEHGNLSTVVGMPVYTIIQGDWRNEVEDLTDQLAYVVDELIVGRTRHDRLWANVLRAERDELPIPDPDTAVEKPAP